MKTATNIHHVSGKSSTSCQGQKSKVKIVGIPFVGTL